MPPASKLLPSLGHAASGAGGTIVSTLATYPLDLVNTRLKVQRQLRADGTIADGDAYGGILDAFATIYAREGGLRAFFAGLAPDLAKSAVDSFLFFLFYTVRFLLAPRMELADPRCAVVPCPTSARQERRPLPRPARGARRRRRRGRVRQGIHDTHRQRRHAPADGQSARRAQRRERRRETGRGPHVRRARRRDQEGEGPPRSVGGLLSEPGANSEPEHDLLPGADAQADAGRPRALG